MGWHLPRILLHWTEATSDSCAARQAGQFDSRVAEPGPVSDRDVQMESFWSTTAPTTSWFIAPGSQMFDRKIRRKLVVAKR